MDVRPDTYADPDSTGVAERLRARDPEAIASFLSLWTGPVHGYGAAVCEPDLVLEATAIAFADLFQKVETHPIDDAHLESALMRSTRLAAGEAATVDKNEAAPSDNGGASFKCEMTPLFLAGSPRAPVGVEVLRRMRDHIGTCARCQATEMRFVVAQDSFLAAREDKVPDQVLDAVLEIFTVSQKDSDGERGAAAQKSKPAEARGAGEIVTDHFDRLLEKAEQEADAIRSDALRDAEHIRRQAVSDAERLVGRLQALEFPLGLLVSDLRDETERVTKQIESRPAIDIELPPLAPAQDMASEREQGGAEVPADLGELSAALEAGRGAPVPEAGSSRSASEGEQHRPSEPVAQEAAAESVGERGAADDLDVAGSASRATPAEGKRGSFLRRRRSKRPASTFITVEGSCAICRRNYIAGSEEELARSGWRVSGDIGLCPDCQAKGWQLPEGARLPFRRRDS